MGRASRIEIAVVQTDLPEHLLARVVEAAEIVLVVRVIVRRKGVERLYALQDRALLFLRQLVNAPREVDVAVPAEGCPNASFSSRILAVEAIG